MQFSNDISNTHIEQIDLQARLRLLPTPQLTIEQLYVDGVQVTVLPSDEPPPETLPDLRSPIAVLVRDLRLRDVSISLPDQSRTGPSRYCWTRCRQHLTMATALLCSNCNCRHTPLN